MYKRQISESEATELLHEDLEKDYAAKVRDFLEKNDIELEQCQFDALVSFTYNLGSGWMDEGYKFSSRLIDGIEKYSDIEVLDAFVVWCHVGKKVDKGLANRRFAEARLMIYGDYEGDASPDFTYAVLNANGGEVESCLLYTSRCV